MRFSLSLPPLVVLLLLAFLWFVLLVLLIWFAFRPRYQPDEAEDTLEQRPRSRLNSLETTPKKSEAVRTRSHPPAVRVTESEKKPRDPDAPDDFDNFNRPNHRRDDFDF